MTNKERLMSLLGNAPADDNSLEGALIDAGIVGSLTYDISQKSLVRKAAIYVLEMLLSTPDTGNSDPAFSIRFDRAAIQRRIDNLKMEQEDGETVLPTIRAVYKW